MTSLAPDFPSLVAVIVAVPGATARTDPADETVATLKLFDVQLSCRPVRMPPPASRVIAVSERVAPATRLAEAGLTVTLATGASVTVVVALPARPSLVAVIAAVPAEIPRTVPVEVTVATAALDVAQVIARPVRALPSASPPALVWSPRHASPASMAITSYWSPTR